MFGRLNNDQWSSVFWFICAVVICIASFQLGIGDVHNPGAGFTPFTAGSAIFLFSVIGFVTSTLKQQKGIRWKSPMKGVRWGKTLFMVGALFAYAFLLTPLGFSLCTALYISLLLGVGKIYRWPVAIAGGIVTASATYGIFVALLKVQFPVGPWGF